MPCNLYGPGDHFDLERSHVLSALVKKIVDAQINNKNIVEVWGSGEPKREWLYIDDLADGCIWAMNNLEKTDTFFNIGVGYDISIKELVYKIADIVGYNGNFSFDLTKPNGMMKKCLDVSKINKLGWKAKTSFEEGLKMTIDYYKEII
jgi:GDP-L-fucose synthase